MRRSRSCLLKTVFAQRYGIPLVTLRDWEQVKATPEARAQNYLRMIERDPEGVACAIAA